MLQTRWMYSTRSSWFCTALQNVPEKLFWPLNVDGNKKWTHTEAPLPKALYAILIYFFFLILAGSADGSVSLLTWPFCNITQLKPLCKNRKVNVSQVFQFYWETTKWGKYHQCRCCAVLFNPPVAPWYYYNTVLNLETKYNLLFILIFKRKCISLIILLLFTKFVFIFYLFFKNVSVVQV